MATASSGFEGSEAMKPPHSRLGAIFVLSGTRRADEDKRERTGQQRHF